MKLIEIVTDIVCKTLIDPKLLEKARRRKGAFTRNCGKLPFWTVMKMLMSNVKKSISAMLDDFFTQLRKQAGMSPDETIICSQQAFSKARAGIDHSIFKKCFYRMLDFLCSPDSLEFHKRLGGLWGVQFIAIDGSKIPLPNRKQLRTLYGGMGRDASSPTAIASIAFDVLNERILDAQFEPLSVDERTLAIQAMMEKNLAEMKSVVSDIRTDFANFRSEVRSDISNIRGDVNDMKGDMKALNAKVDAIQMKFGWYLVLFGVAVSVALFVAQKIFY